MSRKTWYAVLAAVAMGLPVRAARSVIVLGSGDPAFNDFAINPPTGPLANSGGRFEGRFNAFLGTAIAPQFFITARHIGGGVGDVFTLLGTSYPTIAVYPDPAGTDFQIWKVNGAIPAFAPLYLGTGSEVGRQLVAYGRGTQRGADATMGKSLAGWLWGAGDSVVRWGTNTVTSIVDGGSLGQFIYATFDQPGLGAFECHLSVGDSGGGLFIQESGTWKLAGIHYAVDGPFSYDSSGTGAFNAALFDSRGFYTEAPGGGWAVVPDGGVPVPTGFYSTQISSRLPWILSVTMPDADEDGDGLPNLAEYAFGGLPFSPSPLAVPTVSVVTNGPDQYIAISYTHPNVVTDLTYVVEVSGDLQDWSSGDGITTLVSDIDEGASHRITIRDNAPQSDNSRRFIRVRVTRP